jgi:hypothetical protein
MPGMVDKGLNCGSRTFLTWRVKRDRPGKGTGIYNKGRGKRDDYSLVM